MTTTIQVEEKTKQRLDYLKDNFDSKTYDQVINKLIRIKTRSMAGAFSKGKKITFKQAIKGLRDKNDRY